jgi:ribonuclease D
MIPAKLLSYGGGSAKFEVEDGLELIQRLQMDVKMDMLDPQCLDANISNLIELNLLTEKAVLHLLHSCEWDFDCLQPVQSDEYLRRGDDGHLSPHS